MQSILVAPPAKAREFDPFFHPNSVDKKNLAFHLADMGCFKIGLPNKTLSPKNTKSANF